MTAAARSNIQNGKNVLTRQISSPTSLLGSRDGKAAQAVASGIGSVKGYRAANRSIGNRMQSIEREIAGLGDTNTLSKADQARYAALSRDYDALRTEKNSFGRMMGVAGDVTKAGFGYLNSGTIAQRGAKFGLATAGYVGAAGVARGFTSGGNAFYDGDGRTDLAGVPFI